MFNNEKQQLIEIFNSLGSKICLTSDVWTGPNEWPYICITAHWIDLKWNLIKKIIAFRIFEYPHSGQAIANTIENVCKEYKINNKIMSISFDNASNNNTAITLLKSTLNISDEDIFHCRCACHILNLILQEALGDISPYIDRVRQAILFIRTGPKRYQQFKKMCEDIRVKPRKFKYDASNRWNTTYDMLKSSLPYSLSLIHI